MIGEDPLLRSKWAAVYVLHTTQLCNGRRPRPLWHYIEVATKGPLIIYGKPLPAKIAYARARNAKRSKFGEKWLEAFANSR